MAGQTDDITRPVVTTCLTTQLMPGLGAGLEERDEGELRMLGSAIDALLCDDVCRGLDLLCQQFKAVEMAQREGWIAARHLNPVADSIVPTLRDSEREDLCRQERHDISVAKMQKEYAGSRGAGASRAASPVR